MEQLQTTTKLLGWEDQNIKYRVFYQSYRKSRSIIPKSRPMLSYQKAPYLNFYHPTAIRKFIFKEDFNQFPHILSIDESSRNKGKYIEIVLFKRQAFGFRNFKKTNLIPSSL